MDIRPDDTQMAAIPLSHAYGLGNLLMPVLLQGTAVVLREGFVPQRSSSDARDLRRGRVPRRAVHVRALHRAPAARRWPPRLGTLISAGARLETTTRVARSTSAFGVKIHSFYGTSETGGIAYDDSDELRRRGDRRAAAARRARSRCRPRRRSAGGGRVHVAGPAVAAGYAGEPFD